MNEALCFVLGGFVGAWGAWSYWLRHEKASVELKIDPAVINQINNLLVMAWLEQRGLVWMPKGQEFKAKVIKP